MSEMLRRAIALKRHGALTRPTFGKPRGTRDRAADRKEPLPGHYYPGTPAWFTVLDEPLVLDEYVEVMWTTSLSDEMRVAAVHVIEEFGDGSHVASLAALLHEGTCESERHRPEPGRGPLPPRCHAAHALATIGGRPAEESLWRALESEDYPTCVREAALDGLLDLLTPDGWDNYNFMHNERCCLSDVDRARLSRVRGLSYDVGPLLESFDKEPVPKNAWPCPGKPEDLKGQPIGMYHCEVCGEMQLAGVPHLAPQIPSQWEEPFPKDEEPPDYGPGDETPDVTSKCPSCDAPDSVTFTREEERFPYGVAPRTVELTAVVDKGRCASCSFEFTDWRGEIAHDEAVKAHLASALAQVETVKAGRTVTAVSAARAVKQVLFNHRRAPQNGSPADQYTLLADIVQRVLDLGLVQALEGLRELPALCAGCGHTEGATWNVCAPCEAWREKNRENNP